MTSGEDGSITTAGAMAAKMDGRRGEAQVYESRSLASCIFGNIR